MMSVFPVAITRNLLSIYESEVLGIDNQMLNQAPTVLAGLILAISSISSLVMPFLSSRAINILIPSAAGGLSYCPKSSAYDALLLPRRLDARYHVLGVSLISFGNNAK